MVLTALLLVSTGAASPAVAASARSVRADTARSHPTKSGCRPPRGRIAVGGTCGWVGVLGFGLGGSRPSRAVLRLSAPRSAHAAVRVGVRGARASVRRRLGRNGALAVEISRMLPASPRKVVVTVTSRSRRTIRLTRTGRRRPTLEISTSPQSVQRRTAPPAAKTPAPPDAPAPTLGGGTVWVAAGELAVRPTSGPAWDAVKAAADGPLGTAKSQTRTATTTCRRWPSRSSSRARASARIERRRRRRSPPRSARRREAAPSPSVATSPRT